MTVPGGGVSRLKWDYGADGGCTARGLGWAAAVTPSPTGGYRAALAFESGEKRRWPEVGDQSQSTEHCRRWVRRVLVSERDRNRWLRTAGRLPRGVPPRQGAELPAGEWAAPPGADPQAWSNEHVGSTDAARLFGVTPGTISRWAKEGRLPHAGTLGGQARFALVDLEALAGIRLSASDPK